MAQSPYDITLFMDSDFVINTKNLALEIDQFEASQDPVRFLRKANVKHLDLPFNNPGSVWSTLFLYKKSLVVDEFFNVVTRLANNWMFVRESYKLGHMVFRNDVAFELAAKTTFGSIPSFSPFYLCEFQRSTWRGEPRPFDTHAMHKTSLMDWYLSGAPVFGEERKNEQPKSTAFTSTIIR